MVKALVVSYEYHDLDVLELRVTAWNGRFGGDTKLYAGRDELTLIATALNGFPANSADNREVVLGAFGPETAGGAVRLIFYCKDRAGHASIELQIEADHRGKSVVETTTLTASVEAAAMDLFLPRLELVGQELSGSAMLRFSDI
jgi:hypothetical protein